MLVTCFSTARRDEEALRDRLVRAALGHLLEHLALAGGELVERILAPTPPTGWLTTDGSSAEPPSPTRRTAAANSSTSETRSFQQVADALRVLVGGSIA